MKKTLWLLMIIIFLTLAGCNNTQGPIGQVELSQESKYDISIQSPIVFSKNSVAFGDNKTLYVNIEMMNGQYVFDEFPGALQGNNWSGQYQIRIYTDEGSFKNPIYLAPIFIDGQTMNFKSEFSLVFDDYNDDNNPDFTLGQYVSSNGYEYALFTINQTGEVEKLDTDGLMFISEHDYSVKLEKLSLTSFRKSSYDNSVGETVERVYQWTDDRFIPEDN